MLGPSVLLGEHLSRKFVALVCLCSLISGCAAEVEPQELPTIATSTSTSDSASLPSEDQLAKDLIQRSFEEFESRGMTEIALSDGIEYRLLFDPSMEDYQAVLLDTSTDQAELVFETDYFTLFTLYLMLETDDSSQFQKVADDSFFASSDDFGSIRFYVSEGLIVGAEDPDGLWESSFTYSVDSQLRARLETERQRLIDSFTE